MLDYSNCLICPRNCGVDRNSGNVGICGQSSEIKLARAALHFWEEPCISGDKGSGTIFFSGCNMHCVFCQNNDIANGRVGKAISDDRLVDIMFELKDKGANNINLVTATHYAPTIIKALDKAKTKKLDIPIVYNTSGYESVETIKEFEGLIDIYLPDFKYYDNDMARRFSKADDYKEIATLAIDEMVRQVKTCEFFENNEDGLMKKGVIVRHLVLPSYVNDSKRIVKHLHERYGDNIFISIMSQFTPLEHVKNYSELDRKITSKEYDEVVDFAIEIGVLNGFIQDGETAEESFIPSFNYEGV